MPILTEDPIRENRHGCNQGVCNLPYVRSGWSDRWGHPGEHKRAEVQAIGAGAVNQALKALILATGYLKGDGIDIVAVPEFVDVEIEDKIRTAIKLVVELR